MMTMTTIISPKRAITAALLLAGLLANPSVQATDKNESKEKKEIVYPIRKIGVIPTEEMRELVIVGNDTVPNILPERNYGRYDRGLFNYLFLPKGQWMVGMTASYASFDAEDVEVLKVLSNFDFNGETYSIRPYISYVFHNNQSIGLKFNYSRADAGLGNMSLDMGDDLNFSISDVSYKSANYGMSVFYRHYIGLSRGRRFGVFNEVDLGFESGSSTFTRNIGGEPKETRTYTTKASLSFSPGVQVFAMDFISFNVSFGVFGVHLTNERQKTNGVEEGSRFSSGANFKFNIFNINFGLCVHL